MESHDLICLNGEKVDNNICCSISNCEQECKTDKKIEAIVVKEVCTCEENYASKVCYSKVFFHLFKSY